MKKYTWKIILAVALAAILLGTLTSCDKINGFLHGNTGSGVTPQITAVYTEKAQDNWYESKEYLFNKDCTNPMALNDGEKYYIVLEYDNPGKLAVSSVKINGTKYDRSAFVEGSNYEKTKLLFQVEERAETETITYIVNNVMYSDGTSTSKMKWAANVLSEVSVAIRPFFQLTLNDMNVDYRAESYRSSAESDQVRVASSNAYYGTKMSSFQVYAPDYSKANSAAVNKRGGWVFAGWYTQPGGKGLNITDSDVYFFWCNITLYAYFERMYEIETVDLPETIEYTYGTNGITRFSRGAVVKLRDDFKNSESSTHNPALEIPNTVTVEEIVYSESTGDFGLPVYSVNVTRSEYPVVKIDNKAFYGFNTIETASIGKFVEEIGYGAFWDCTKLESLSFANDSRLKYIGDYAFRETEALGVTSPFGLPDSVEYIGNLAFRNSGWTYVPKQSGGGTSTFTVKKQWRYLGTEAFMGTGFTEVVFEAGCHFEDQINETDGKAIESAEGYREIREGNLIGSYLFAGCIKLARAEFRADEGENNALNIIPDRCFDIFNYKKNKEEVTMIGSVFFSEGLTYIGQKAFYYQEKIPELALPATLEEVDIDAFYQCVSVEKLTFAEGSRLRALHNSSFGNLTNIDAVTINSAVFEKYGSGIFRGCDKLKCVIFTELTTVPTGYYKGMVDERHKNDVIVGHKQADFLYATGEAGEKKVIDGEEINADDDNEQAKTYSSPLRVFCRKEILEDFEREMLLGKELEAGSHSTGTSSFSSSVFVHALENIRDYTYVDEDGKTVKVQVAVQEIYKVSERTMSHTVLGYSLVYWSERSEYIPLPTMDQLNLQMEIIELAYYALPTSVRKVYVPSSYTRIDHDAFNNCTVLTEVDFEDINTLEYIGDYAFFGTRIRSFVGGTSLKVIGQYAFQRCLSLKWVDLRDCPINNTLRGRTKLRTQCKYKYEVTDDEKDYADMLGYGAFKGCQALEWVYLPQVQQIMTATFSNCKKLATVIIPTPGASINRDTSATNDAAFYEYGQPNTVFDPSITFKLDIYVDQTALEAHRAIWDRSDNKDYNTISASNVNRPED